MPMGRLANIKVKFDKSTRGLLSCAPHYDGGHHVMRLANRRLVKLGRVLGQVSLLKVTPLL